MEQIIRAQNDVQLGERALKVLLNIPGLDANSPTHFELVSAPDPVEYSFDASGLNDAAIENRMELLELELQLARDAANIAFAENQKLVLSHGSNDGYNLFNFILASLVLNVQLILDLFLFLI